MSVIDLLNPITAIAKVADSILGKFVADPAERAAAQLSLYQAQTAAQQSVLDYQTKMVEEQAKVVVAEATSESWLTRNWRPITMVTFLGIIVYQGPLVSIFHWPPVSYDAIPERLWSLLELGIGGYIASRGIEKAAPGIIRAITAAVKK